MQGRADSVFRDTEVTHVTAPRLASARHSHSDCWVRGRSNHSARNCEAYRRDRREVDYGATNPGYYRFHRPKWARCSTRKPSAKPISRTMSRLLLKTSSEQVRLTNRLPPSRPCGLCWMANSISAA